MIHAGGPEHSAQRFQPGFRFTGKCGTNSPVESVHHGVRSGLGVAEFDKPNCRQLFFPEIPQAKRNHIVPFTGEPELFFETGILKIRKNKGNGAPALNSIEVVKRLREIRTGTGGLKREDFADDSENVPAAFFRGDVFFDPVGEKNDADFIVVPNRGKRENSGKLGSELILRLLSAAELAGSADIDDEQYGEFAFFLKFLDVRMTEPRSDIPIDGTNFVAGHVLADFLEFHSAPLENRMILSAEHIGDFPIRADFNLPDFAKNFFWNHGTGTSSKMRLMTDSLVKSSASAS